MSSDGLIVVDDIVPGRHQLLLPLHSGLDTWLCSLAEFEVSPGQPHDLGTLPDLGFGTAVLRLDPDTTPVRLDVTTTDEQGRIVEVVSLAAGEHRRKLLAGKYTAKYVTSTANEASAVFHVQRDAETPVPLTRHAGRMCRIELECAAGWSESYPLVARLGKGEETDCRLFLMATREADHWQCDADLQPGDYLFRLTAEDGGKLEQWIAVTASTELQRFELRLPRAR